MPRNEYIISFVQSISSQEQGSRPDGSGLFSNPTILLLLAGIVLLLAGLLVVLIFFTYRYLKREKKVEITKKTEKEEPPDEVEKIQPSIPSSHWERLSLEEKLLIKILSEKQGNILQKELPGITDYSKSTITRIIARLEEQDLIYRTPAGRGYRVFLKDKN
ncbi:MAG: MarR family transcriptional regulator [Candidatus Heimdallarchaeota archaeon]|nr:MarR family transcriptional regulator [Candidatus Heimdallarchaeota archaeon]